MCERGDWQPCASASGVKVVVFTLGHHGMFIYTNSRLNDDRRDLLHRRSIASTGHVIPLDPQGWFGEYSLIENYHDFDLGSIYNHGLHRSESIDALAVAAYSHADRTASINNVTEKTCDKGLSHASVDLVTPLESKDFPDKDLQLTHSPGRTSVHSLKLPPSKLCSVLVALAYHSANAASLSPWVPMAASETLNRLASQAEDVASTLRHLRDQHGEPSYIASITEAVAKLFGISTELRRLAGAFGQPQYYSSLYRIERDVQLVYRSVDLTLGVALTIAHRTRDSSQWMIWGDLDHRTRTVEGSDFLERLSWYQSYIQGLLDLLEGYPDERLVQLRNNVVSLLRSQQDAQPLGPSDRFIEPGKFLGIMSSTCHPW